MTDTCAYGDHHDCAGVLSERRTAAGETVVLCAHHEAAHAVAWSGVLPALRRLDRSDADTKAGHAA